MLSHRKGGRQRPIEGWTIPDKHVKINIFYPSTIISYMISLSVIDITEKLGMV